MTQTEKKKPPEVSRFIDAQDRLDEFKEKHPKLFKELYELIAEYNESLQAADMAVRSTGVTHEPFIRERVVVKYDADKLYDALGLDGFVRHGGIVETVSKYTIDKKRFDSLVSSNVVPQELVDEIKTTTPHYKKIDKLVI